MTGVRLGLRFDPRLRGGPAAVAQHAALLALGADAERLGFDVLWVAERPDRPDGLAAGLPICAALAARTVRARVASGVLPLALHHPVRVAEDAATLDGLSGGRFELGVGLGGDALALAGWGIAHPAASERFLEGLALLAGVWSGAPALRSGGEAGAPLPELRPRPLQPGGPPLWVGARAATVQRRAAELGAGLLLPVGDDPEPFLAAAREHGQAARLPRLGWLLPDAGDDPEHALDAGEELLARFAAVARLDLVFAAPPALDAPAAAGRLERLAAAAVRLRGRALGTSP